MPMLDEVIDMVASGKVADGRSGIGSPAAGVSGERDKDDAGVSGGRDKADAGGEADLLFTAGVDEMSDFSVPSILDPAASADGGFSEQMADVVGADVDALIAANDEDLMDVFQEMLNRDPEADEAMEGEAVPGDDVTGLDPDLTGQGPSIEDGGEDPSAEAARATDNDEEMGESAEGNVTPELAAPTSVVSGPGGEVVTLSAGLDRSSDEESGDLLAVAQAIAEGYAEESRITLSSPEAPCSSMERDQAVDGAVFASPEETQVVSLEEESPAAEEPLPETREVATSPLTGDVVSPSEDVVSPDGDVVSPVTEELISPEARNLSLRLSPEEQDAATSPMAVDSPSQ